jgi:hypothetical protein
MTSLTVTTSPGLPGSAIKGSTAEINFNFFIVGSARQSFQIYPLVFSLLVLGIHE